MAADVGKVYPTDIELLKRQLETQGEQCARERLERKAEVDRLRLEVEALKRALDRMSPGFLKRFDEAYADERREWNPELEKPA